MNPKSGKACQCVAPAEPAEAFDADDADPGKVAEAKADQIKQEKGKYSQTKVKPFKPAESPETTWIEVCLIGEDDKPVAGERYQIELPDGSVTGGSLDGDGLARVEGIAKPGECKITFPDLDKNAWEAA